MRVLVATNPKMGNPYTRTLMEAVGHTDPSMEITIDKDVFWTDSAMDYDIIHVMFPHELVQGSKITDSAQLQQRFTELKAKSVKIVSTCHNFEPHYSKNVLEREAYETTYTESDMIVHLAGYSQRLFEQSHPSAKNVMLYHHTYDNLYDDKANKAEARRQLGLSPDKKYLLSFGVIRSDEERDMLTTLASMLPDDVKLWVPSFYRVNRSRNPLKYGVNLLKYLHKKLSHKNIRMQRHFVSHEDLPLYFTAADAVLLPRKKILNSGNLPLAYYFRQPVAGPNVGNVGAILMVTGNYAFDPADSESILQASLQALSDQHKGTENKDFAQKHFVSSVVARQLVEYYKTLLG